MEHIVSNNKVLNISTGKLENCNVGVGCKRHAHSLDTMKPLNINLVNDENSKYYVFHQNNTGGIFENPAKNVIVKAESIEEANKIAESNGVYFDENYDIDCECCGTRWNSATDYYAFTTKEEALKSAYDSDFDKNIPNILLIEEPK